MADVHLQSLEDIEWTDSLVLLAFPSTGSAASIAGHYLRVHLGLPLVGGLFTDNQLPLVAVHEGVATSPVRIFGGETECRLDDGECPRLYIVTADLVLEPPLLRPIADRLMDAAKDARMILCLESINRDEGDDTPDVYAVASDRDMLKRVLNDDVKPLPESLIIGMTGEILLKSRLKGVAAAGYVVEATQGLPDGRAAAALIHAVSKLVPDIPLDAEPLLKEALELEQKIQKIQSEVEQTQTNPRQLGTFI